MDALECLLPSENSIASAMLALRGSVTTTKLNLDLSCYSPKPFEPFSAPCSAEKLCISSLESSVVAPTPAKDTAVRELNSLSWADMMDDENDLADLEPLPPRPDPLDCQCTPQQPKVADPPAPCTGAKTPLPKIDIQLFALQTPETEGCFFCRTGTLGGCDRSPSFPSPARSSETSEFSFELC
eukprot:RCo042875